ncbi:MAG: hypothetical protein EA356_13210 [Geminicoccaceae bacterium]|nr:MAG: hypothetical protein EA356_13210 [Geminicoccaceae bacterium]
MSVGRRDRKTLRNYFRGGALPTAEHFGELIDSSVNKVDDGFDKTPADGLKIAWLSAPNFMSFYRGDVFGPAVWRVSHDPDRDSLQFNSERGPTVTSLAIARGRVGVNTPAPTAELDVAGTLRTRGRIGYPARDRAVPADGEWHPLTDWLTGCQAFEVMAGVGGGPKSGRYALVHAVAMNAFNPQRFWSDWFGRSRPIRTLHAAYGRSGDRLALRWRTHPTERRSYRLELRSRCRFKGQVFIHSYLTQLWFDPTMAGSTTAEAAAPGDEPALGGDT